MEPPAKASIERIMKFFEYVNLVTFATTLMRATAASSTVHKTSGPLVTKQNRNLQGGLTCSGPSLRRAWRDTSCDDQEAYLEAVKKLKQLEPYPENPYDIPNLDQFSRLHNTQKNFAHGSNAFLQWHRWYISGFEKALQIVSGRCIFLSYWDWEVEAEDRDQSYILKSTTFGSVDDISTEANRGCVNGGIADYQGFWATTAWEGNCLKRAFNGYLFCDEACLMDHIVSYDTFQTFSPRFESYPHGVVHSSIGENMMSMYAPDDPLFFPHHANVDRVWAIWQDYWNQTDVDPYG
ncbi:hypothetical protein ACHAWF_005215, partial [Thalassiosira exigua]